MRATPSTHDRWELTVLEHDSWRICDPVRKGTDADCLIAYVDRKPSGVLDVVWLCRRCPTSTRFSDFTQLFDALDLAMSTSSDRSRAPSPIPHQAPFDSSSWRNPNEL